MDRSHLTCLLSLQWLVILLLLWKVKNLQVYLSTPPLENTKPSAAEGGVIAAGAAREVSAKVCSAGVDYRTEYAELPPFTLPEDIAFIMGEDTNGDLKPFPAADFLKSLEIMRCTLNDALRIARTTTGPRGPTGPKGNTGAAGKDGPKGNTGATGKCKG
jgi:hypothetical protein